MSEVDGRAMMVLAASCVLLGMKSFNALNLLISTSIELFISS